VQRTGESEVLMRKANIGAALFMDRPVSRSVLLIATLAACAIIVAIGLEWLAHSMAPRPEAPMDMRVTVGRDIRVGARI
jgi:hypothetical protein